MTQQQYEEAKNIIDSLFEINRRIDRLRASMNRDSVESSKLMEAWQKNNYAITLINQTLNQF